VNTFSDTKRLLVKRTLSGCGTLYVKKRRLEVPAGHIFVIERPGPYTYCYEGDGTPWSFEFASISFTNPTGLLPEELKINPVFRIDNLPKLEKQISKLVDIRTDKNYVPQLAHSSLAYDLFISYISIRRSDFTHRG